MPTYEYVCDACGHQFEEFQSITADALTKCPACKKKKLRRLIGGGAALLFKGSGFYLTDYRSESYKKGAKADSESKAPKSEGGGSDNKGAAKSESKPKGKASSSD